jgi:hypothetical protein
MTFSDKSHSTESHALARFAPRAHPNWDPL